MLKFNFFGKATIKLKSMWLGRKPMTSIKIPETLALIGLSKTCGGSELG